MMHKTALIFLGAIAGAGLTLLATQPHTVFVGSSAEAASSDTYRQLALFGEVFERVDRWAFARALNTWSSVPHLYSYVRTNSHRRAPDKEINGEIASTA